MKTILFIGLLIGAISFGTKASTWANASGKISNIQVWPMAVTRMESGLL
ncbi:hypothetical protein [Pseudoalteromonas sp. Of7M-16]|nr:hypothetical protein [Pseudoalteromonas sp. Of7M-16]MCG7550489.1 hypothetical protein [Pseudoalteromonas sp. Of7M-16]